MEYPLYRNTTKLPNHFPVKFFSFGTIRPPSLVYKMAYSVDGLIVIILHFAKCINVIYLD